MTGRVLLIHWNAAEAKQRAELLRDAGYRVDHTIPSSMEFFGELRSSPPAAVVIDLSRLPSHGRDIALGIRHKKATRQIPLVFVGGEAEKVERVRGMLPDAVYTEWSRIRGSLKQAILRPPRDPIVPKSMLEGYSGKPLASKLGIKANSVVALDGAPPGFRETLGDLPEGVRLTKQAGRECGLTLWFVRSRGELHRRMRPMAACAEGAPLWIVWPKQASGMGSDVSQQQVREAGLAAGLVDYKVCAVDATWSGLLFRRRKV